MNRLAKVAAVAAAITFTSWGPASSQNFITFGGGPTGGTYYAISSGMASIFNEQLKGVEARVRATSGAFENPVLIQNKDIDLGPTNANLAVWALKGEEVYRGKEMPNVALFMAGLAGGLLHVVVPADSSIQKLGDLKGKRIAVGPQGNTTALMMNQLLAIYGISPSDYSPIYVNYNDGFSALADGNADAAIINTAPPVAAIRELGIRRSFRLLPVEEDKQEEFLKKYPFYDRGTISASVYDLPGDVSVVGSQNVIIIRRDLDDDLVYQMTKAVFENLPKLHASHPSARAISAKNAAHPAIPLHPGAERYLREVGALN